MRLLEPAADSRFRLPGVCTASAVLILAAVLALALHKHASAARPSSAATQPSYTLSGAITDDQGRPISNALVAPLGQTLWNGSTTDHQGKFLLKNVRSDQVQFVAYSQRRVLMTAFTADPTSKDLGAIVLDCLPATVKGRIVNSTGLPIAGAQIDVHVIGPDQAVYTFAMDKEDHTDNSGQYEMGPVPARHGFSLTVSLRGQSGTNSQTPPVAIGRQLLVQMPDLVTSVLRPAARPGPSPVRYSGRVLDQETQQPIVGVKMDLAYPALGWTFRDIGTVLTDADGKWSCLAPPELSEIQIRLDHPDYIGTEFDLERADTPPIHALRDGSAVQHMKRGQRITGHVFGADGKPLWNALVLAGQFYSTTGGVDEAIEDSTAAHTDRDGSFSIGGILTGQRQLVVSADDMAPTFLRLLVSTQTPAVAVKMQAGHDMSGRVMDENGMPIVGAHVTIGAWTMTDAFSRPLPQKAMTNSAGRFQLSGLPSQGMLRIYTGMKGRLGAAFEIAASAAEIGDITLCSTPRLMGHVVDEVTGQPIKTFKIKLGFVEGDGGISYSSLDASANCRDGVFDIVERAWDIDRDGGARFAAKITADGYAPQVTPYVSARRPSPPMIIRLKRAPSITGTVVDAQNAPIATATVFWVSPINNVRITGTEIAENYAYTPDLTVKTDAAGKFSLPASSEPGRILVLHEKGYALLGSGEYQSGTPLKLNAWARIEGKYMPRGKAAAVAQIQAIAPRVLSDPGKFDHLNFQLKTITDAEGHFVIDHVPALPFRLEAGATYGPADFANILAQPGLTLRVDLGRTGTPVTGRIDLSQVIAVNPPPPGTSFDTSTSWIRAVRVDPPPQLPAGADPADWNSQLAAVMNGTATENLPIPAYFANLQADGSYSFIGLPPGKYELLAVIHSERPANTCGWGLVLARGHASFNVADSALELPVLSPDAIPHPAIGGVAPEITGKDSVGKDFALSSLRGKYVVLDFWAGWCGPCRAALPVLQDVYRKHASPNFAFVGLNYDYNPALAASAIAAAGTPWPNILLGPWDGNSPVLQAYDVSLLPSLWLIDPQGHIAARDLTPDQLDALLPKSAVRPAAAHLPATQTQSAAAPPETQPHAHAAPHLGIRLVAEPGDKSDADTLVDRERKQNLRVLKGVEFNEQDLLWAHATEPRDGKSAVILKFNEPGAHKFDKLAATHGNQRLAIVLDGELLSVVTIRAPLLNAAMVIGARGGLTTDRVNSLKAVLHEQKQESGSPLETLDSFTSALHRHDIRTAASLCVYTPEQRPLLTASLASESADGRLREASLRAFGEKQTTGWLGQGQTFDEIQKYLQTSVIQVNGDTATVLPHGPQLRKIDGTWKIVPAKESMQADLNNLKFAAANSLTAQEIEAGKFKDLKEAIAAFQSHFAAMDAAIGDLSGPNDFAYGISITGTRGLPDSRPAGQNPEDSPATQPAAPPDSRSHQPGIRESLLHAALVELSHDYALKEGEIMRVIKPPFLKARSIAIQDNYGVSAEAAERVRHVSFLWRNGVAIPGAWSDQDADLDFICRAFVDLPWYRLDADAKYPALHGDLIVREDATPEQKLQALTSLIEKETNSRIELMHKKVTRASIVLHGKTDVPGYSFVDNMQLNMAGVGGYAVFITAKPLDDAALSHRAKRLMLFGSFGRPDDTSKMSLEGASFQLGAPFVVDANQDGQFRRTNLFLIGDDVGLWRTGDPGYAENLTRVVANLKKQLGGDWRIEQRDFDVLSLRDAAE